MRIKGTPGSVCRLCENSEICDNGKQVCKLNLQPDKCKKYKYDIFRYEPRHSTLNGKFSKEDFEI